MSEALRAAALVGEDARVRGAPVVRGQGPIRIGRGFRFAATPVLSHLICAAGGRIDIGDGVCIDFGAAIHAEREISIGDRTRLGAYCVVMDTDFHRVGEHEDTGLATPVRIGRDVVIEPRVTILRGAEVGDGARVLAGSVVSGVVPPGATVAGVPARVVRAKQAEGEDEQPAEIVRRVLIETLRLPEAPGGEVLLEHLPGWTSLLRLQIVVTIEDALGVEMPGERFALVRKVSELVALAEATRR
ncbi:MAG: hypothetical protein JST92_04235 [Deltaproteobacteria bacterium]|nr:hypothetical protein [Deltaproteobacteria bacterium]